jgi:hypothetical protein
VTEERARAVANLVLASAGVAAAYVIVTSPPLRRLAVDATRYWLGGSVSNYLITEARRAWIASAR